jgi:hypothetical protein
LRRSRNTMANILRPLSFLPAIGRRLAHSTSGHSGRTAAGNLSELWTIKSTASDFANFGYRRGHYKDLFEQQRQYQEAVLKAEAALRGSFGLPRKESWFDCAVPFWRPQHKSPSANELGSNVGGARPEETARSTCHSPSDQSSYSHSCFGWPSQSCGSKRPKVDLSFNTVYSRSAQDDTFEACVAQIRRYWMNCEKQGLSDSDRVVNDVHTHPVNEFNPHHLRHRLHDEPRFRHDGHVRFGHSDASPQPPRYCDPRYLLQWLHQQLRRCHHRHYHRHHHSRQGQPRHHRHGCNFARDMFRLKLALMRCVSALRYAAMRARLYSRSPACFDTIHGIFRAYFTTKRRRNQWKKMRRMYLIMVALGRDKARIDTEAWTWRVCKQGLCEKRLSRGMRFKALVGDGGRRHAPSRDGQEKRLFLRGKFCANKCEIVRAVLQH